MIPTRVWLWWMIILVYGLNADLVGAGFNHNGPQHFICIAVCRGNPFDYHSISQRITVNFLLSAVDSFLGSNTDLLWFLLWFMFTKSLLVFCLLSYNQGMSCHDCLLVVSFRFTNYSRGFRGGFLQRWEVSEIQNQTLWKRSISILCLWGERQNTF